MPLGRQFLIYHWKASQIKLPFSVTRGFVSFRNYNGLEISDVYRRANLFPTSATDAAALIGILAIYKYSSSGVSPGVITPRISEIVYYGLIYLAMMEDRWSIDGSSEEIEQGLQLIGGEPNALRRHRIKELFGIHERRASRFMSVDSAQQISTYSDISAHYEISGPGEPLALIVDAQILAMNVATSIKGNLFKLERVRTN